MNNKTERSCRETSLTLPTPTLQRKALFSLLLVLCSLLTVSCEDMFQQKISKSNAGAPGSLDAIFAVEEEIDKLSSPEQFYIAPYYSSTEIRLTWNEVRGAAYYMVERAEALPNSTEPDDGDYEILDRFVYRTSYVDKILENASLDASEYSNRYYYRVSAFNPVKKYDESDPCTPQSAMLFRPPGGLKASGGVSVDYVQLEWEKTSGASSYEIFRSDFSNGASAASLGTVYGNQNWFQNRVTVNEQGKDFYYMITAQNSFGNKTMQTRPAYGYAKIFGAPDAPEGVRLKNNSGRGDSTNNIEIEWDEVFDAEYYAVYRYSSVDSSLSRLTERTEEPTWLDSVGLRPGVYYYYKVQAIVDDIKTGKALKSQFSDSDPEGFILSPPETVIAEKNTDGSVTVKWLPALGNENERFQYRYEIYADNRLDGDFSSNIESGIGPSVDGEGYISKVVTTSHTFFRIATVKGSVTSEKSAVVSPAPAAAVILDASQYAYIPNFNANTSGVYPVKITWEKPADENPAFYHVQRSSRSGSGFSRINETALNANGLGNTSFSYDPATGVYTYIDSNETARTGRKYYYRILSLNQLEQGNFPSGERIGWGALTHTQYMLEYNRTIKSSHKKLTYMHKPGTSALGSERANGAISGSVNYNAAISGLGARITMRYESYADFYIENEPANGPYFIVTGNTNTSANMSSNGSMDGTMTCTGMYPGKVYYDRIEIKGGGAGGGAYGIEPDGFPREEVSWTVGEQ